MNKPTPKPQHGVKISKFAIFPQVSIPVFLTSALLIIIFMISGALFSETTGQIFNATQNLSPLNSVLSLSS